MFYRFSRSWWPHASKVLPSLPLFHRQSREKHFPRYASSCLFAFTVPVHFSWVSFTNQCKMYRYKVAYIIARDILMSVKRDFCFFLCKLNSKLLLRVSPDFEMKTTTTHSLFIDIDSLINRKRKFMNWCQNRLIEKHPTGRSVFLSGLAC